MGAAKRFTQNPGSNAICYYRYSSDAQRDVSIAQQQEAAQEYAASHGYHIIKEYEDHAISGTRDDRPGFQTMLYEVEKLRPAYLILWKTDRLSRDRIDAVIAKKRLRECGVKIVYVAESIPDDDEATQILMESLYEAMAASFIVNHRKNVVRGLNFNAENCLYNGIRMLGYKGQPDHKYEIDETTAPTVRRIFTDYASGKPMTRICDELNNAGIKTINGNRFTVNSMRRILTNRAYISEYRYGEYVIPDGMPRIIDDSLFETVQARLENNKRGGKAAVKKLHPELQIEDYWLSGKLFCGLCGGTMQGVSGKGKKGATYCYYSCQNHRKHACTMKSQRKDLLERIVRHILHEMLFEPSLRICIAERCYAYYKAQNDDGGAYEASIKAQLKDVEAKLANIMSAIEAGIFTATTAERMNVLENQKSMLRDALLAEQNRKKYDLKPETVLRFLEAYVGDINNPQTTQRLLDFLVSGIYVYPDKLAMTFYFTDDCREFSFADMKELFENQQRIADLMNDRSNLQKTPLTEKMLASLIDDTDTAEGTDDPDFFP